MTDATHFNAEALTDKAGAKSDYEVVDVHGLAAFHPRRSHVDVGLIAVEVANEVANDDGAVPLRTGLIRSADLESDFVTDREIANAAARAGHTGESDVLGEARKAARSVTGVHNEVDVTVDVDRGLDSLEGTDSLSEVGEVTLHRFDVDAHGGEVSLEGGSHSLKVGDVIAVSAHGSDLLLESVQLSSQGSHFLGVTTRHTFDSVDLVLKAHDHASKLLVGGVDRAGEFIAGSGSSASEHTIRIANEDSLVLHVEKRLVDPVILRHIRELFALSEGRDGERRTENHA
jgi:hypothetical protein